MSTPPLPAGYALDSPPSAAPPPPPGYALDKPLPSQVGGKEGFWHSFSAFLPGYHEDDPYGAVKDLAAGIKEAATHPLTSTNLLYHGIVDPMAATNAEAKARWNRPGVMNKVNAGAEWLESGVPVLGPVLAKAGNQMESGDVSGSLGTMTGAALPMVAPEMAKVPGAVARQIPGSVAPKLYQSALKPPPGTYSTPEVAGMVKTGLNYEIPVSAGGADKLSALVRDLNEKVQAQVDAGTGTVNKFAVASRLGSTAKKFETQVNPEADLQAVGQSGNEFLRNQENEIPVSRAQKLKTGTYQQLGNKAYGELSSATIESQKALARGIKEELETQFPEIRGFNAQESQLYDLQPALERAVRRIDNHDIISLGSKVASGAGAVLGGAPGAVAGGMMEKVLGMPMVKSKIAIALAGRAKIPQPAAAARVAAYVSQLENANAQNKEATAP